MNWRKSFKNHFTVLAFVGVLLSCVTLVSCFENPDLDIGDKCFGHYLSEDFREHTFFKAGSYWIYEDAANHIVDSIYLSDDAIYTDPCNNGDDVFERGTQTFHITHLAKDPINDSLTVILTDTILVHFSAYKRYSLYNDVDYINQPEFGFFADGAYYEDAAAASFFFEHIDSKSINDRIYSNIIVFDHETKPYTYYWSRDVGLVKKEYESDFEGEDKLYDFELVKYKLN